MGLINYLVCGYGLKLKICNTYRHAFDLSPSGFGIREAHREKENNQCLDNLTFFTKCCSSRVWIPMAMGHLFLAGGRLPKTTYVVNEVQLSLHFLCWSEPPIFRFPPKSTESVRFCCPKLQQFPGESPSCCLQNCWLPSPFSIAWPSPLATGLPNCQGTGQARGISPQWVGFMAPNVREAPRGGYS